MKIFLRRFQVLTMNKTSPEFSDGPLTLIKACEFKEGAAVTLDQKLNCLSSRVIGFTAAYLFPIYGFFGSVTNVINFLVFFVWWPKTTRQTIYLGSLALADFGMILTYGWVGLFPAKGLAWASNGRIYYKSFADSSPACRSHNYLIAVFSCCTTSLFLLMVAERVYVVFYPIRAQRIGLRSAWIFVVGVTALSFLLQLPVGMYVRWYVAGGKIQCWIYESGNDFAVTIFHSLTADVGVLQTTLILLLNIALTVKVASALAARSKLQEIPSKSKKKEIRATVNILILSAIYIVCCLPQVVGYTLATTIQYSGAENATLKKFGWNLGDYGWFLFFFQESMNWVVYMTRMPTFRLIVVSKFCGRKLTRSMFSLTSVQSANHRVGAAK